MEKRKLKNILVILSLLIISGVLLKVSISIVASAKNKAMETKMEEMRELEEDKNTNIREDCVKIKGTSEGSFKTDSLESFLESFSKTEDTGKYEGEEYIYLENIRKLCIAHKYENVVVVIGPFQNVEKFVVRKDYDYSTLDGNIDRNCKVTFRDNATIVEVEEN